MPSADVPPSAGFGSDSAIEASFTYARSLEGCSALVLPTGFDTQTPQQQMLTLFNLERSARTLAALTLDTTLLSQIDLNHSREMVQYNYFDHSSPINQPTPPAGTTNWGVFERDVINPAIGDGAPADPYHWSNIGENIAACCPNAAQTVYEYMYMDSSSSWGHRNNILGTYNTVGIGAVPAPSGDYYFSSDFLEGSGYVPPTAVDTTPPSLNPPTISGTTVTVTHVADTGASTGAAGVTGVVVYVGSSPVSYPPVVAAQSSPGTWTASLSSAPAAGSILHAVAVDGSGNYTDCPSTATSTCGASPTVAPLFHLSVRRRGLALTFRWRAAVSGALGFLLFAGTHPLTSHLIPVHRTPWYRFTVRWPGRGPYTLRVVLRNGDQLSTRVPSAIDNGG